MAIKNEKINSMFFVSWLIYVMSNIKLISAIIPIIIKTGIKNGVINTIINPSTHANVNKSNNPIIKLTILYKFN